MIRQVLVALLVTLLGCSGTSTPKPRGCPLPVQSADRTERELRAALQQLEGTIKTLETLSLVEDEILGIPIKVEVNYELQQARQQAIELRLLLREMESR